jgi:adenylosuccinate synthase
LRGSDAKLVRDIVPQYPWLRDLMVEDGVSAELNSALDRGKKVLVEGTQGFGLSVYHSDFYPHCTSRDTTAAGFLSEVGLSPRLVTEIVVVFRTFPIRVAGDQAGPLRDEITWQHIQRESGCPHPLNEFTSVTNKPRRVARFDWELARHAIRLNRPTKIAVNGLDYISYRNRDVEEFEMLTGNAKEFVLHLAECSGTASIYVGIGPQINQTLTVDVSTEKTRHTKIAAPKYKHTFA